MRVLWIGSAEGSACHILARLDNPQLVPGVPEALEWLEGSRIDVIVASLPLAGWTAESVLDELLQPGRAPVILLHPEASVSEAVRLSRAGAWHVIGSGAGPREILDEIAAAAEDAHLRESAAASPNEPWRRLLIGGCRVMDDVGRIIRLVGPRRATVLITGETGTGKEIAARAIHMASPRAALPLISVSCAALPEHLLEAELFGHVRGAFTGAVAHRIGRFEQANGSTLFLDEVGELPLDLQAKLLRVLQEREFQRLGSGDTVRADVRVVAATNADLAARVREGRFREDLYYRINVVPLHMPPLRARQGDIALLACHFVEKICRAECLPVKRIAREALGRLVRLPWPGNVRQLENAVETAVALSGDRPSLETADFNLAAMHEHARTSAPRPAPVVALPDEGLDFERTVSHFERNLLEQALRRAGGNKTAAADMLRLKRTTLAAKLRSLEASWPGSGAGAVMVQ